MDIQQFLDADVLVIDGFQLDPLQTSLLEAAYERVDPAQMIASGTVVTVTFADHAQIYSLYLEMVHPDREKTMEIIYYDEGLGNPETDMTIDVTGLELYTFSQLTPPSQ